MPFAFSELGVVETPGSASTSRVLEYLRSTTLDRTQASHDSTPWCSAFVCWCLDQAGVIGTRSAAARSWLSWGQRLDVPRRGCLAVLSRSRVDATTDAGQVALRGGHVGFYLHGAGTRITLLGGNQMDAVTIAPYDRSRLLGYRVP